MDRLFPNRVIRVGEMVIYKVANKGQILILPDRRKIKRIGLVILAIAIALFLFLGKNNFKTGQLMFAFVIALPFGLMGLGYYLQASKKNLRKIVIDLNTKKIIMQGLAIPYSRIACLSKSRLLDANEWIGWHEHDYFYQLYVRMDDGKEILLFTDESKFQMDEAAQFIAQQTGLTIDPTIKNA